MDRNLDRRVEALVKVTDPAGRRELAALLELAWDDDVDHFVLGPDGDWQRTPRRPGLVDFQQQLITRPRHLAEA